MLRLPTQEIPFSMTIAEGFQIQNTAVALAAAVALIAPHPRPGVALSAATIQQALTQVHLPARMEILQQNPTVLLDGAHNPDKMSATAHAVMHQFPQKSRIVVLGLKKGKAAHDILPHVLTEQTRLLILTAFYKKGLWNPHPPQHLAEMAREMAPELDIRVVVDPLTAVSHAITLANPDDLVWITGSLYLAGDVRAHWYPVEELIEQAEIGLPGSLQY